MDITPGTSIHGFTFRTSEPLAEIDGRAHVATHEASGAQLLYLENDDANKAFSIAFRTPPQDDTGVFHILEHSVLCGSEKFPVKEPFVDLLKGSMQTFLNAMTFGDKTMYPVASTNEQDLFNLMDVYLDAVFHPQIYNKLALFEQEGWHYELVPAPGVQAPEGDAAALDAEHSQLVYNGVVYNEMKGSLSDANSVLYDEVQKALFPDTPYAFESGGIPRYIPNLTYENYLDEHRRHYRTDNSYIVLYGNVDIDRALEFLDERYLRPVAAEQAQADAARAAAGLGKLEPRTIGTQAPVHPALVERTMDTAPENACAACGYVVGTTAERVRIMATEILLDALFGSNEAPLKRALLDADVADDVSAFVADSVAQPFAMVQVNVPHADAGAHLEQIVAGQVEALLERGIDRELIEASLSHAEFQAREHDMGIADGVGYAMMAMAGWLYDDQAATAFLRYEDAFAELRAALDGDYFATLARSLFLENAHVASVQVVPTPGQSDDDTDEVLAKRNAALSAEERRAIVDEEAVLRAHQETPDSPQAVATLPRLTREDIGEAPHEPAYELDWRTPVTCLRHSVPTRGIVYAYRYFDANRLTFDELPYATVLALVLGKLDTAQHTAAELDTLSQGKLGNLSFYTEICEDKHDPAALSLKFVASASALSENADWLATLPREVLVETDYSNTGKILDVLQQRKIGMEQNFAASGHACAGMRVKSYYSRAGVVGEHIGNVDFYRFLCDTVEHFDERSGQLSAKLADIAGRLFVDNGCTISFAGSDEDYDRFWLAKPGCGRTGDASPRLDVPDPVMRNEGFVVASDVCYAGMGWDLRLLGRDYEGAWMVVSRALSFDYLWNEVRVKGGAYGVGFNAARMGNLRFYSYRDPHLDETLERFAQASSWLAEFDPSDEDLEGFIVATTAGIDAPVKPRALVRRQASEFFGHCAPGERAARRRQVIECDAAAIRALAPAVAAVSEAGAVCVFGNRDILQAASTPLDIIDLVG